MKQARKGLFHYGISKSWLACPILVEPSELLGPRSFLDEAISGVELIEAIR